MKHRKFFSLALALALLLIAALPLTASAAPMASDGTITITPPGILVLTASDFKAYKLFNVTRITGAAPNYQFGYEPAPAVETFLKSLPDATARAAYGVTSNPNTNAATLAAACEEFRVWLQGDLRQGGTHAGYEETFDEDDIIALAKAMINSGAFASGAISAEKDGVNVKFGKTTPLDYGYYLVTGSGLPTEPAPKGEHSANVISRGMLVNVPELTYAAGHAYEHDHVTGWSQHAVRKLKADAPKIDKEVWYHDLDGTGNPNGVGAPASATDPGWQKWTDVGIGDTVYFKHTSKVPDMTGYDKYQFIVHDYMSPGLTFNASSVNVYIGGSTTPLNNTGNAYYTVASSAVPAAHPTVAYANGTYITITFKPEEFVKFARDAAIVITYTAQLNENAVIGAGTLTPPGNPNKVWLEYSNNPNWNGQGTEPTGETPEDEVIVYTFDLEIYKYTGTLNGTDEYPLKGAEFELKKKIGAAGSNTYGPAMEFVLLDPDTTTGYNYRVAKPTDTGKTTKLVISTDNGKIRIKGLDAGVYELKETKAPVGYNLVPGYVTIVEIVHTTANGISTLKVNTTAVNPQVVNIQNNTGGQLPGTGGIGLYVTLGVGGVMAILVFAAYMAFRKKKIMGEL